MFGPRLVSRQTVPRSRRRLSRLCSMLCETCSATHATVGTANSVAGVDIRVVETDNVTVDGRAGARTSNHLHRNRLPAVRKGRAFNSGLSRHCKFSMSASSGLGSLHLFQPNPCCARTDAHRCHGPLGSPRACSNNLQPPANSAHCQNVSGLPCDDTYPLQGWPQSLNLLGRLMKSTSNFTLYAIISIR